VSEVHCEGNVTVYSDVFEVQVGGNVTVYVDVCEVQGGGNVTVYIDVFLRYRLREMLLCTVMCA